MAMALALDMTSILQGEHAAACPSLHQLVQMHIRLSHYNQFVSVHTKAGRQAGITPKPYNQAGTGIGPTLSLIVILDFAEVGQM